VGRSIEATEARVAPLHGGAPPPLRKGTKVVSRVTLGELVEAVAAVTLDPTEQAAVVNHMLRRGGETRRGLPEGSRE
jgi:hypothetical protein